jgi:hypothetical protein
LVCDDKTIDYDGNPLAAIIKVIDPDDATDLVIQLTVTVAVQRRYNHLAIPYTGYGISRSAS